jgi:uncharacterized repeat protein (TIGR02543 family)
VLPNGKASKPADPVRSGYDFAGWFSDSLLTVEWDFDNIVTGNLVLRAKWMVDQSFSFPVADIEMDIGLDPISSGIVISRSGTPATNAVITVLNSAGYSIEWWYNNSLLGTGAALTLSVDPADSAYNMAYNIIGTHLLTVIVEKAGVPYSKMIEFEVIN